jgi:branched-chain amino acid transport system ATP-binding protein
VRWRSKKPRAVKSRRERLPTPIERRLDALDRFRRRKQRPGESPALRVSGLEAGYGGAPVFDKLGLRVNAGEAVAVLGPNGAGKTTLLRAISGLLEPEEGSVAYGRAELAKERPDRILAAGIAHVPQGRQVFAEQKVYDNLMLGAYLRRDREAIRDDLDYVLEIFPDLRDKVRVKAGNLSGGQQQALAIGRALMSAPSLLLLDEPSLGLAPRLVDTLTETLRTVHDQRGVGMLIVEQDALLALELSSRAYVLQGGKIVMERPAASLMGDRDVLFAYLGGGPDVDSAAARVRGRAGASRYPRGAARPGGGPWIPGRL